MTITPGARISNRSTSLPTCDALIVGGGPAGLAASIALRQHGLDVVVADALTPPIDKACGEGLMPDSRRELVRLGVELTGGREFSGFCFANRNRGREDVASAEFSSGKGVGIRRLELHRQLIERAEEIGVRLKWNSRVDLRGDGELQVGGEAYQYRYLVGADGEGSRVRRWAGLENGSVGSQRLGFRRHYRVAPWSDCVEVHWGDFGQAYVTPVAENEVCVAAITSQRERHFDGILEALPYLQDKLCGQATTGRHRGAVTTTRKLYRVTRGNIALVGDASGSADAITGSGLASAFREALLLGECLGRDAIADYEAGHAKILLLPRALASMMILIDRWPWLRDHAIRVLAGSPELFARMLAVHVGEEGLGDFAVSQGARLAFRLLLPELTYSSSRRTASQQAASVEACVPPASHDAARREVCQEIA